MVHKISLMDAYLIETIRSAGITNENIISKMRNRKLEDYKHLHDSFDFTHLFELADRGEDVVEEILEKGYEINFLTFPGLKNLLKLKFQKFENEDYEVNEFVISKLQLNEEQEKALRTFLSANWIVENENEGIVIKPVAKKVV